MIRAAYMESQLSQLKTSQLPLLKGLVMEGSVSIEDVLFAMRANKTGCVVVTEKNKVIGIFTERDFLTRVVKETISWKSPIAQVCTKNPLTLTETEPLSTALTLMKTKNIRHLPIFDGKNDLKGVLSIRQIIQLFAEFFPTDMMNLPPRLNKQALNPEGG